MTLPVDSIRDELLAALAQGPVVLTAPTGTGKSTQVPRWMKGRVLMVQPRRVACRAVAGRVAELEKVKLGERIGYRVRDDDCSSANTEVLVVTPGIVLSQPSLLKNFDLVILDEFHERRLDTDLLLALLLEQKSSFITMSATMDGRRVAAHVGGLHLKVEARSHDVDQRYSSTGDEQPSAQDLEGRVLKALKSLSPLEGDALVFLPGKGEIASTQRLLEGAGYEVTCLHGALSLEAQSRVLKESKTRRVILSTNVAETSVTIPGVRAVLDSGLVRRTAYHGGRSYLTLTSLALDSADQRAGRAGRTAPGICVRLWGARAQLKPTTPPEIHRESLIPLLMTTAGLNLRAERLPFLDPPKDYALLDARKALVELGALNANSLNAGAKVEDHLTERGRALASLPLDPWASHLLIEAEQSGALAEAIDLVAALEQSQAYLFVASVKEEALDVNACDAVALITAVREGSAPQGSGGFALREARASAKRLRRAFGLKATPERGSPFAVTQKEREGLIRTLLKADPSCAHIARNRKKRLVFAGEGTELFLARESRVNRAVELAEGGAKPVEAILVLATRAFFSGRDRRLLASFASQVPLKWLVEAKLGEERVAQTGWSKGRPSARRLVSTIERVLAGKVIGAREEEPKGELSRQAVAQLFLKGRLHPASLKLARYHLARRGLAARLGQSPEPSFFQDFPEPPTLEHWLSSRLLELGVESGEDLQLLSEDDFVPEGVPSELASQLDERFPDKVDMGDCLYRAEYDLEKRQVMLHQVRGNRKKPPPANYLPKFSGLRVFVEAGGTFHPVRR